MDSIDRLSYLSDALIIDVLTCMEIQHAVRTCALSKRWTRLWTQLPCIYLNFDTFNNVSFIPLLLGVLTHFYDFSNLCSLLTAVISIYCKNRMEISNYHLSCSASLRSISLDYLELGHLGIQFPIPFRYASVRSISLEGVRIDNDISFSSQNLESFYIVNCSLVQHCYVSLQSANTKSRGVRRREMSSLSMNRYPAVDLKMKLEDRLSDLPEG
ncbi:hypothetical protein ACFE04_015150 [Oxalis oulophora]